MRAATAARRAALPLLAIAASCALPSVEGEAPSDATRPAPTAAADPTSPGRGDPDPPGRMLRLVLRLADGGPEIVASTEADDALGGRDPHARSPWFYRAFDGRGRVLSERGFALFDLRRVPPPPGDGEGAAAIPIPEPVFDLAVPLHPDLEVVRLYRAEAGGDRYRAALVGEVRP